MGEMMIVVVAVGAVAIVLTCIGLAVARVRDERRRQDRLSVAFDRAQAVRTRGSGLQGSPYGVYAETAWSDPREPRGR